MGLFNRMGFEAPKPEYGLANEPPKNVRKPVAAPAQETPHLHLAKPASTEKVPPTLRSMEAPAPSVPAQSVPAESGMRIKAAQGTDGLVAYITSDKAYGSRAPESEESPVDQKISPTLRSMEPPSGTSTDVKRSK